MNVTLPAYVGYCPQQEQRLLGCLPTRFLDGKQPDEKAIDDAGGSANWALERRRVGPPLLGLPQLSVCRQPLELASISSFASNKSPSIWIAEGESPQDSRQRNCGAIRFTYAPVIGTAASRRLQQKDHIPASDETRSRRLSQSLAARIHQYYSQELMEILSWLSALVLRLTASMRLLPERGCSILDKGADRRDSSVVLSTTE